MELIDVATRDDGILGLRRNVVRTFQYASLPLHELVPGVATLVQPEKSYRIEPQILNSKRSSVLLEKFSKEWNGSISPAGERALISNAKVIGAGVVTIDDKWIVEESFTNLWHVRRRDFFTKVADSELYFSTLDPHLRLATVEGRTILLKQAWDTNYGHWLIDSFSRLAMEQDLSTGSTKILLRANVSDAMKRVFIDSLRLLGIEEDSIVWSSSYPTLIKEAIYLSPITRAPLVKSTRALEFLEGLVDRAKTLGGKSHAKNGKVFLRRSGYGRRELIGEGDLVERLEEYGYVAIHPEKMSLFDQIVTFFDSTHVVGVMGASFSNLVFSTEGVQAFLLAPESMWDDYFYDIICHKKGSYFSYHAQDGSGIGDNFRLDLDDVMVALREAGFIGG